MDPTLTFLAILIGGAALIIFVVYHLLRGLIKSAVKDALREYEAEKETAAAASAANQSEE